MKVHDLLSDLPVTRLAPDDTALAAALQMAESHVGSVLVCDPAGKIRGIFTERDLMVRVIAEEREPRAVRLEEVMTKDVFVTTPDKSVTELRQEMQGRHIRHVPVVSDGEVLAVLSVRDLIRADLREKRRDVQALTDYIRGDSTPPPPD
ncbi:MAG: CBS domain-containing protein [Planctomycetota bacterium]|nr:MAG: CBS domain-containing protein [Planctomycetota bacterium]